MQAGLALAGLTSLAIFAWLQAERFYFERQYREELFRSATAAREHPDGKPAVIAAPHASGAEPMTPASDSVADPSDGAPRLLARLRIQRISLDVAVLDGIDNRTLRRGAGWIPGTARPGERGNVGLAAHRDTFFRPLRHVRPGDAIELDTPDGVRSYFVRSTTVVDPEMTAVLEPIDEAVLTLVTCFPFYYVGPAPQRYIVRAVAEPPVVTELGGGHDEIALRVGAE